ncbi:ornithine cyclodeaminase family protein [Yaniella sp.]|uniref:ornithine cyclodeaminase family protein n=1 Tax=Yaniella sp. TaxID=2773929 RepID=UPI002647A8B5|nr:ornithine cyclodeaminase family protein [Yaniella sp.]MDN5815698.1 ornithine cyclodeaminase family protein [Yaniella sp.]
MSERVKSVSADIAGSPRWIGAEQIHDTMPFRDAVTVLEQTLLDGYDPETDGVRTRHSSPSGQLLQMPSATDDWCGTKLVTVRSGEQTVDLPVIQGLYMLFEGKTLRPVATLEGAGLTALRTPAVTALAIRHLVSSASGRVTLFGSGVQARAHVRALMAVFSPTAIDVVGRDQDRAQQLADEICELGIDSSVSGPEVVAEADLILCCTSSSEPLFDGNLVQNHALVAAIGSHDPYSREVDTTLVQRSSVIIESLDSAMREAGDVVIPQQAGDFHWDRAITMRDLIVGVASVDFDRPRLFKGTGMPWQDLAIAASIYGRTVEVAVTG